MDLTAEELALLDPFPDIVALFLHYNSLYFGGTLHTTSVQWSSERMTRQVQCRSSTCTSRYEAQERRGTIPHDMACLAGVLAHAAMAMAPLSSSSLRL